MRKFGTKHLILSFVCGSVFFSGVGYAASATNISVYFQPFTYFFDGQEKKPADGKGFIYEGSTYVPLRFVSEALGKSVDFDPETNSIYVGEHPAKNKLTEDDAVSLIRAQQHLEDNRNVHVEVDHIEESRYVVHVYEIVIDDESTGMGHTATWGWYYVDMNTGAVTSMF